MQHNTHVLGLLIASLPLATEAPVDAAMVKSEPSPAALSFTYMRAVEKSLVCGVTDNVKATRSGQTDTSMEDLIGGGD
eukprot:jgi/Chlat1/8249/Chrsp77S07685